MSYFLCLALIADEENQLRSAFDKRIFISEASNFPIGRSAISNERKYKAFLLQIGSSSATLIGKGGARKTHNNDHSELLISGLQSLLIREECSSVSFLAHWTEGMIAVEQVPVLQVITIAVSDLQNTIRNFKEDTLYIVSK